MSREQIQSMPLQLKLALSIMMDINLYWPLLNLLPIWPLDGGKVTRELCTAFSTNGIRNSLVISIAAAGFIAVHALLAGHSEFRIPYLPTSTFAAIFFALLAFESYQLLQHTRFMHYEPPDDRLPWER
jgi:Zn-dependent protease